jgi:hypothetical protein
MKATSLLQPDVIGIYVGVAGIILACVFYIRSKEQVRPRMLIEKTTLIGKEESSLPESVEIRYGDRVIPILSKARITFWNAGRKTLDDSDVAQHDPIIVKFPEQNTRLLDVRSVTTTRDVINAKAAIEGGDGISLSFDFLDCNDGLALEAFFDGDSEAEITIGGTIKGVRGGIDVKTNVYFAEELSEGSYLDLFGRFFFGPFNLIGAVILLITALHTKHKVDWVPLLFSGIFGLLGIVVTVVGVYAYIHLRIPPQLRKSSKVVKSATAEELPSD